MIQKFWIKKSLEGVTVVHKELLESSKRRLNV